MLPANASIATVPAPTSYKRPNSICFALFLLSREQPNSAGSQRFPHTRVEIRSSITSEPCARCLPANILSIRFWRTYGRQESSPLDLLQMVSVSSYHPPPPGLILTQHHFQTHLCKKLQIVHNWVSPVTRRFGQRIFARDGLMLQSIKKP